MNYKNEQLKRIYYGIEIAERSLDKGVGQFAFVEGFEQLEHDLNKIKRLMDIVSEDIILLLEREVK